MDIVELDNSKTQAEEEVLPENNLRRYLQRSGEQHGDQKISAGYFICSKNTYTLKQVAEEPGNCVLQRESDRDFLCEELMHFTEDTQVPPE